MLSDEAYVVQRARIIYTPFTNMVDMEGFCIASCAKAFVNGVVVDLHQNIEPITTGRGLAQNFWGKDVCGAGEAAGAKCPIGSDSSSNPFDAVRGYIVIGGLSQGFSSGRHADSR